MEDIIIISYGEYYYFSLIVSQGLVQSRAKLRFEKLSVCVWVYGGTLVHHFNGIRGPCAPSAPPKCNVHHGAQGRLCFLKKSGCPDNLTCHDVFAEFYMLDMEEKSFFYISE